MAEPDGEQPCETGMTVSASIESKDELVEISLKMVAAEAVIDAERPGFEVGEHPMDPGKHDMGGHRSNHMGLVPDVVGTGIGGPAVGLGGGVFGKVVGEEAMQAGGGEIVDLGKSDASGLAVVDLNRAGDQKLALGAAAAAAPVMGSSLERQGKVVSSASTRPLRGERPGATMASLSLAARNQADL